jgi:hypothetical protein
MSKRASTHTCSTAPPERSTSEPSNREHVDQLLDRALADTFPASDPVSSLVPEPVPLQHSSRQPKRPE